MRHGGVPVSNNPVPERQGFGNDTVRGWEAVPLQLSPAWPGRRRPSYPHDHGLSIEVVPLCSIGLSLIQLEASQICLRSQCSAAF